MSAGAIVVLVLLSLLLLGVVVVARGRPRPPRHTDGSLMRGYQRGGRGYQRYVVRRIRAGRPRRRR